MAENFYVFGFVSQKSPQFSGHSTKLIQKAWHLFSICAYVSDATTTRVVSWESVYSRGLAAGSPSSNINQPDIWNKPEAPHLITTDAFTFQLSAKRFSVQGARSTPHNPHGGGLSSALKSKLNNLGLWLRQKFPSVICQLKPTPGRHFACSSKITVVGQTWIDYFLYILGVHILPILQMTILLELTIQQQQQLLSKPFSNPAIARTAFFSGTGKDGTLVSPSVSSKVAQMLLSEQQPTHCHHCDSSMRLGC